MKVTRDENLNYQPNTNGKIPVSISMRTKLPSDLIEEITKGLHSVGGYGSIEIIVQDHSVTQITVRNIKKTKHFIAE